MQHGLAPIAPPPGLPLPSAPDPDFELSFTAPSLSPPPCLLLQNRLMTPPNATWVNILAQARQNPEVLKQSEVIKSIQVRARAQGGAKGRGRGGHEGHSGAGHVVKGRARGGHEKHWGGAEECRGGQGCVRGGVASPGT